MSADEFVDLALALPWFSRVGQPSDWDDRCVRLGKWTDWPGPESEEGALFYDDQEWIDAVRRAAEADGPPDLLPRREQIRRAVIAAARPAVPDNEGDDDPYLGWNTCLAHAGQITATIASFLTLGWPVPADLEARWAWFAAGHWPCGYAYGPRPHLPPYRLLVF
jgi:hypothetical protein